MLDFGSPKEVLALAMDPPNLKNMCSTVMFLKEIGALLITANGVETQVRRNLTSCTSSQSLEIPVRGATLFSGKKMLEIRNFNYYWVDHFLE